MCARLRGILAAFGFILSLPALALAQGTISGVARDTTGAVLPGVTVEASSPALIEKTRSVVTDAEGQYKIVNLRPGTYAVTFTLAGFNIISLAEDWDGSIWVGTREGKLWRLKNGNWVAQTNLSQTHPITAIVPDADGGPGPARRPGCGRGGPRARSG